MKQLVLLAAIVMTACTTTLNTSPPPTVVPDSLSKQDVEQAIIMCFRDPDTAGEVSMGAHMAGELFYKRFGSDFIKKYWHYEGRGEDKLKAGYTNRKYYMHVEIDYSDDVVFSITDSRNLRQSDKRIHKSAVKWLGRLESDIRICLGEYDRYKYQQEMKKHASADSGI